MTPCTRTVLILMCVLALAALGAQAMTVASRGNQLLIDGRPTSLLFARGFADPSQLPYYRSLGFNTLLLRIDSTEEESLKRAERLADAAAQAGLLLLVELARPVERDQLDWSAGLPPHPRDAQYQEVVSLFLDTVVPRFSQRPNMVGWVLSAVDDGQLVSDVEGFPTYLECKYHTLEALNKAWAYPLDVKGATGINVSQPMTEPRIPDFAMLSEQGARQLAAGNPKLATKILPDLDAYVRATHERDADFQAYVKSRYPSIEEVNGRWDFRFARFEDIQVSTLLARDRARAGSSPLSLLELARYRQQTVTDVMDLWVRLVSTYDAGHLFFAGGQSSYRTMACLSGTLNGVFTECYPGVTETDLEAHDPQAFDIARRGNRFIVLGGIQARGTDPRNFAGFLYEAALHGVSGIGVSDWQFLLSSRDHALAFRDAVRDLSQSGALGLVPAPHVAIVYSPFAPSPPSLKRPLYGYMPRFLYHGPSVFFFFMRQGTTYGQIDYLTVADLDKTDLSRYHTILMPTVLDVPEPAQEALWKFVEDGGTLVADVGLGTLQANGDWHTMPPRLWELFGVEAVPGVDLREMNLEVYTPHPRFPTMPPGLRSTGLGDYAIRQYTRVIPFGNTQLLCAAVPTKEWQARDNRPRGPIPQKPTCGIFLREVGKGCAVYASMPLYPFWLPGLMMFEEFHRDLFGHGARVTLAQPFEFLPNRAEVASCADGSVIAWTKNATRPLVSVQNVPRQIFVAPGARCEITESITQFNYDTPGFHMAHPLPIFLDPAPGTISPNVLQYSRQIVNFTLDAADPAYRGPLSARICDGTYALVPGSRHRVTVFSKYGAREQTVTIAADRSINVTIPEGHGRVAIVNLDPPLDVAPVPDPGTAMAVQPVPVPRMPVDNSAITVTPIVPTPVGAVPTPPPGIATPQAPPTGAADPGKWTWTPG